MHIKHTKVYSMILLTGFLLLMTSCKKETLPVSANSLRASDIVSEPVAGTGQNPCVDLSVPTYITKVNDTYFIVDCYHNQVIYHDNL